MIHLNRLHHVRLRVADLAQSLRFATDFGFGVAQQSATEAYLTTSGIDAYTVVLEAGHEPALLAIAFAADTADDLDQAVRTHGATPRRPLAGPGGGEAVGLLDPEGRQVLLVHGVATRAAAPLQAPLLTNDGTARQRQGLGQPVRAVGPQPLLRLGHVGLFVGDYAACDRWYREVLGLLPSDLMYFQTPDHLAAGFYRLNRGDEWVDHHTLGLFGLGKPGLHHLSFEIQDIESQRALHRHLLKQGRESIWGVGRHPLGSHVFDLWRDPNGFRFETFTDTDVLTAAHAPGMHPIIGAQMDLWLDQSHERYFA